MYRPRKFRKGDELTADALNAMQDELIRLGTVRVGGGLSMHAGPGGFAFGVTFPTLVKVAKVGGSAIAAMSGSTPGSGAITLYNFGATALAAGDAATAYNLASGTVTANAWIMVAEVDNRWVVVFEACA